jgi:hypothetical protein
MGRYDIPPSRYYEIKYHIIGRIISCSCYVIGWFMPYYFAGRLVPRHRNPPDEDGGPNHWEIWLRDLDGYKVVLASPDGTADGDWRP